MTNATYSFRMWKVWLFLGLLFTGYATVSTFDAVAHPTIAAELAVGQLQDTESGAISMRTYDRVQNFIPLGVFGTTIMIGAYLVFGAALFKADIARLFPRPKENPQS